MTKEHSKRIEEQMLRMVEGFEKEHLRTMQADMHKCAATCYENDSYSRQKVQSCVENCSSSLNRAYRYIEDEFQSSRNRLERCVTECNDRANDKMRRDPSQSGQNKYSDEFETCATKCVDSYCESLPNLEKTMNSVLSSQKFAQN